MSNYIIVKGDIDYETDEVDMTSIKLADLNVSDASDLVLQLLNRPEVIANTSAALNRLGYISKEEAITDGVINTDRLCLCYNDRIESYNKRNVEDLLTRNIPFVFMAEVAFLKDSAIMQTVEAIKDKIKRAEKAKAAKKKEKKLKAAQALLKKEGLL